MKKITTIPLLLMAFCFVNSSSHAAELTVLGGISRSTPEFVPASLTFKGRNSYGGGALLGIRFKRFFGLEVGGLYVNRKYGDSAGDICFNTLQLPALLRFRLLPMLSFGVGGYYTMGIGNVTFGTATSTFADAALKKSDYGVVGDARLRLPLVPTLGFIVDFRYLYGLGDYSTLSAKNLYLTDVQLFAGLQFGL
ncbi:outer membrane beta-barrel protein [Bdellovibrionota bacterium FG-2]